MRAGRDGAPAAFTSATEADPHAPVGGPRPRGGSPGELKPPDPLRLCVATTVALLAWLLTPPLTVLLVATAALIAYARARRAGLLSSRCKLGDTRLVMAYLVLAAMAGAVGVAVRLT
jgi:hypothetical protein